MHTGCLHCYAETQANRFPGKLGVWGPNGTRVLASDAMWREPVKWNAEAAAKGEQHRVFCASLADIFEEWPGEIRDHHGGVLHVCGKGCTLSLDAVFANGAECDCGALARPMTLDDVRMRLFQLIDSTPNLTWQILTKRPGNIRKMWTPSGGAGPDEYGHFEPEFFRHNVHLLYSASDQASLEAGIGDLLKCRDLVPALGLSLEPLVGPIDLSEYTGAPFGGNFQNRLIDWVIVGGESGHGARQCDLKWIRSIVQQCKDAGVPCFVKQLGQEAVTWDQYADALGGITGGGGMTRYGTSDKKGGDWDEWPEDLRVREFPGVKS